MGHKMCFYFLYNFVSNISDSTSLVVWWSELLTANHEVRGSAVGMFPCRGRSPYIITHIIGAT
jgi:hypothetical protein